MKSLRFSLLVYFLGLLAVALGAASWLLYCIAYDILLAKKESTVKLVEAQFKDSCKNKKTELETALLFQAQSLANAGFRIDVPQGKSIPFLLEWDRVHKDAMAGLHWPRVFPELHLFGMGTAGILPGGYLNAAAWVAEGLPDGLSLERAAQSLGRDGLRHSGPVPHRGSRRALLPD